MIKLNNYTVTLKNGSTYMISGTHYIHICNEFGFEFIDFYINHVKVHSVFFINVEEIEEFSQKEYCIKSLIEY